MDKRNDYIKKIKDLIEMINQNLPEKVDATTLTIKSKLPFKVLMLRELLFHRVAELSRNALKTIENEDHMTSILISRWIVECFAVMLRLINKLKEFLKNKDRKSMDSYLMKSLFGSRDPNTIEEAYNILTLIDHANLHILIIWA